MADPRYNPDAIRHDLASLGLFAGIEPSRVVDEEGYIDEAEFVSEYKYKPLSMRVEWVNMSDLWAIQNYWCEQNVTQLQQLPEGKRDLPAVFYHRGRYFLMDGTHRCLVYLLENDCRIIKVRVFEVC